MPEASAEILSQALALLTAALDLIDQSEAPGDIGAHVDLAVQRICQLLGTPDPRNGDLMQM